MKINRLETATPRLPIRAAGSVWVGGDYQGGEAVAAAGLSA